jgi:DNA-binding GntR family transcriptional regulator
MAIANESLPDRAAAATTPADERRDLGARSLTAAVYERVRRDIITNRLAQGEKLLLAALQEQYHVSLSVIREALSRLVADGLVVAEAQRGFRVSVISRKDLLDVMRTRIGIESMAIEQAIENGDAAWQESVARSYEHFSQVMRTSELAQWGPCHDEFHRLLLAPCDSDWLRRFREILFEQSERYRYAAVGPEQRPVASEIESQHQGLVEAVLKRDPAKGRKAIAAHFEATLNGVLARMAAD